MMFNTTYYLYILIIFFTLNGCTLEMIFLLWYFSSLLMLSKLHSHISFMLLTLELISVVTICLSLLFLMKNIFELSFFFLMLCLMVGEACLGLSLMVMGSRFQKKELLSLSLI